MATEINIIPLGGLGEIGINCMAIEYEGRILVIDAGLMFPDETTMPGVDLVIPDFTWLIERADRISGLVLTHGHEDHIGAAGFLLRELENVPVYGTRLTLAMAEQRLKEAHVDKADLIEIAPRTRLTTGPFDLEFIRVNHSILDGVGVAINTPLGAIVHTGDFKIDQANTDDRVDLYKFAEYGENGVLLLLSDSTNADMPGCTDSETVVGRTLTKIFNKADGRVILACFASSLARIRQVARAAKAAGRKMVFEGRGMIHSVKLAKSLGYLEIGDDDEVTLAESADVPDSELVIVATGSQGEPMSALTRMAHGDHKQISIKKGDTVILSARSIPGHEKAITRLIDLFYRQGARVLDGKAVKVHTSGHGQAEELKLMLNLTRPKYFVPIHGETHKLIRHGDLARSLGWENDQIWILENGRSLTIDDDGAHFGEVVQSGRKVVDGNRLGEPEDPIFRNRLKLAGGGLVVVTVVVSNIGGLLTRPTVAISGVHYESDFDLTLEAAEVAERVVNDWYDAGAEGFSPDGRSDTEPLSSLLQKEVRSLFRHSISRRPSIWPQVIVLGSDQFEGDNDDSEG
ncbi:ribonuclease J [Deltaproteobacteria bacterium Smac51]|nr:ribonuclease J [Deltaproteobacteria bacterium Smac51]